MSKYGPVPECLFWRIELQQYEVMGCGGEAWVNVKNDLIYAENNIYEGAEGHRRIGPFPDLESAVACAIVTFG